LPYVQGKPLLRLIQVSTVIGIIVAPLSQRTDDLLASVPPWLKAALLIVFVPIMIGFVFQLLWHYSRRLNDTLASLRTANSALQESERLLEAKVEERTA